MSGTISSSHVIDLKPFAAPAPCDDLLVPTNKLKTSFETKCIATDDAAFLFAEEQGWGLKFIQISHPGA